jgi:hypothetical protein
MDRSLFLSPEAARMPPRQYNLRNRKVPVVWVDDDTLKTKEEEDDSSDSDYEESEEDEESEDESEEEDEEEESTLKLPKGAKVSVKLHIHQFAGGKGGRIDIDQEDEDESEEDEDEFIAHIMDKYVRPTKGMAPSRKSRKEREDHDTPALCLNEEEEEYFEDLSKSKRRRLNEQMKGLAKLVSDGDIPYKFRVLGLPIPDGLKASVIRKIDMLNEMDSDGGEVHKLKTWVDGFLRIPFGTVVPLPVKFAEDRTGCSKFLADTQATMDKAVYGMNAAKAQIMQIVAQWIANPSSVGNVIALKGPMGVGKCHAKDTKILMFDGSVKNVQDIRVGDEVMGDNSTPRTVLALGQGEDMMYDIVPTKGEKYTVNSEHILCLKQSGVGCIRCVRGNAFKTIRFDNVDKKLKYKTFGSYDEATDYLNSFQEEDLITEISVNEYLKLSDEVRDNWLKGYRAGVDFPHTTVDFDPYIIGLWLGDGCSSSTMISSQDAAILGYLNSTLPKYDLMLNYYSQYDYRIRGTRKGHNVMLDVLNRHNMIENKHIPDMYKINDRETRLKVLAGLVDTDGYTWNNTIEIAQKSDRLAADIVFLARSLGFACYSVRREKSCEYKGETRTGVYNIITISGDTSEIPIRIERKKPTERLQKKDVLVTAIDVKCVGTGTYYGFTLDGNCRYLLGDFTVTHNTSFARHGVAEVLKRPFEFFSLGGASDSANFVGHSYTYEGATWGRIADAIMSARCMNPVIYFDELDKVSTTAHGEEIISMLIHLTDRSQNSHFHDRYFAGVDFDLSQCLFVFSFNDETKIHPILKDRMQVINCAGYTADDKRSIVKQYVWPQVLERINMKDDLTITDDAIKFMISEYSHEEEGVRVLIRAVETLVTRINLLRIADEKTAKTYPFYKAVKLPMMITPEDVKSILVEQKQINESWRQLYT